MEKLRRPTVIIGTNLFFHTIIFVLLTSRINKTNLKWNYYYLWGLTEWIIDPVLLPLVFEAESAIF